MCKSIFVISVVLLLGAAQSASAQCSCVTDPTIIDGNVLCPVLAVNWCTFIIESTGSLTAGYGSTLDGPGAAIIVNGGNVLINGRFNVGQGRDGYLTMNGGTFTVTGTFKFPDDAGGVHRIYLNDGIMHAGDIELYRNRDAIIYVGGGILRLDEVIPGNSEYDPAEWVRQGALVPAEGYDDIVIEYVAAGPYTEVRGIRSDPNLASNPSPGDSAPNVDAAVVLSWEPGVYAASHDVYFGTEFDDVNDANTSSSKYRGRQELADVNYAPELLARGKSYYWRIDEVNDACEASPWKGNIWSFTTAKLCYVDADAAGANDGSSWEDAFNYLQDALAAITSGYEIRVAEGDYRPDEDSAHPDGSGNRNATFQLKNGVVIKGGYAGVGAADPNERDPNTYESILSGDLAGDDEDDFANNGENSYHVVTGSGTNSTAVLDGFTISGGNANGSNPYNRGGGMLNYHGSPTLTNCTFIGNSATYDGGGMYNSESSPTLNNCTFSGNSAEGYAGGGGMYNEENSSPVLTNCTFIGNSAGGDGGGMDNYESSPTLTKCMFSGNSAGWSGGMNNGKNSSPTLTDCTFSGNSAEWGGGMGNDNYSSPTLINCTFSDNSAGDAGGMFNLASSPTLTNCTFTSNSGDSGGGMFNESNSSPTLTNCMFTGNLARWGGGMNNNNSSSPTLTDCMFSSNSAESGGGMSNGQYSNPTLTDCTFSGNSSGGDGGGGMTNGEYSSPTLTNCMFIGNSTAGAGGGIHNYESSPTLTNCTFSDNSAEVGGGMVSGEYSNPTVDNCTFSGNSATQRGGVVWNNNNSSSTLTNCILWGNTAQSGSQIYNDGTSSATVTYSDVEGAWPGKGNINADPMFVSEDYLYLMAGSPCIDAGTNRPPGGLPPTDIEGNPRPLDGDGDGIPMADMGADEFYPFEASFVVADKRRVDRTVFEYDCKVTLKNISRFAVKNVQLEMVKASNNMTIIEPGVTFGDVEVKAGESATSIDTCTFQVDRSEAIDSAEIIWQLTCEIADTGQAMQHSSSSVVLLGSTSTAGELTGDSIVNVEDLARLAERWLWTGGLGSIPEDITEDGTVNLADFATLADNWVAGVE